MNVFIERKFNKEKATIGTMQVFNSAGIKLFECKTLELPYRSNKKKISCIPNGHYVAVRIVSPKFGDAFHLRNVDNRSEILIHEGNTIKDTIGCILLGAKILKSVLPGGYFITNSRKTVGLFNSLKTNNLNVYINGNV